MPQNNMLFSSLVWFGTQQKNPSNDAGVSVPLGAAARGTQGKAVANLPVSKQRGGLCVRKSSRNG